MSDGNIYDHDQDGDTPLHLALKHPHEDMARELIAAGADVNILTKGGETPLMLAARGSGLETIGLLMDKETVIEPYGVGPSPLFESGKANGR